MPRPMGAFLLPLVEIRRTVGHRVLEVGRRLCRVARRQPALKRRRGARPAACESPRGATPSRSPAPRRSRLRKAAPRQAGRGSEAGALGGDHPQPPLNPRRPVSANRVATGGHSGYPQHGSAAGIAPFRPRHDAPVRPDQLALKDAVQEARHTRRWHATSAAGASGGRHSYPDERLRDIVARYGAEHTVPRAISASAERLSSSKGR